MALYEHLLDSAPNLGMRNICLAVARDFETLRQSLVLVVSTKNQNQNPTSMFKDFSKKFEKFECMHYAPLFDFVSRPYSRNTTRALLFVASGYLTIPQSVSSESIEFGLRLCSHIFFTQPSLRELEQISIPLSKTTESKRQHRQKEARNQQQQEDAATENQNDENEKSYEFYVEEYRIDRLAKIPIAVDLALEIASQCQHKLLSSEAIQHFKMLKEADAFCLATPCEDGTGVRYGDIAVWALSLANDPKVMRGKKERNNNHQNENTANAVHQENSLRPLFDMMPKSKTNSSSSGFHRKLQKIEETFYPSMKKKNNNNGNDEDLLLLQEEPAAVAEMNIEDALAEYESMKVELGCEELFKNSSNSNDGEQAEKDEENNVQEDKEVGRKNISYNKSSKKEKSLPKKNDDDDDDEDVYDDW